MIKSGKRTKITLKTNKTEDPMPNGLLTIKHLLNQLNQFPDLHFFLKIIHYTVKKNFLTRARPDQTSRFQHERKYIDSGQKGYVECPRKYFGFEHLIPQKTRPSSWNLSTLAPFSMSYMLMKGTS